MVVVWWRWQDAGPDTGTPLPPLQLVERPAKDTVEGGGKGGGLESRQMQTRAGSLSCFPWKNATMQWWTAWQLLKSGSSRPNEWRYGGGAEADSGAGGSGNGGIYPFLFVPFLVSACVQHRFSFVRSLNVDIYISRDDSVAGGELRHPAGSLTGGGGIRSCQNLIRVHTVWINNNNNRVSSTHQKHNPKIHKRQENKQNPTKYLPKQRTSGPSYLTSGKPTNVCGIQSNN